MTDLVVIVTGAASGMGEATARHLAASGASVVVTDANGGGADRVAAEIGDRAVARRLDVALPDDWSEALQAAHDVFGSHPNGLVHCAGVPGGSSTIVDTTRDEYARVVEINLVGTFNAIHACAAPMRDRGGGSIVVVSSVLGFAGMAGSAGYVSSKWAIRGLVRTAAIELASAGVRVNALCPGAIDTNMLRPRAASPSGLDHIAAQVPLGEVADPDVVARAANFLLGDESRYITGVDLPVDGGVLARLPLKLRP